MNRPSATADERSDGPALTDRDASSAGVSARFELERPGFRLDARFDAPGHGITAIFGPSGSGKTTLLRCAAGLERAHPARFDVNGHCWQDEASGRFVPTHRRAIGYVFQEPTLFAHRTVDQNLRYGWRRAPPHRRRIDPEAIVAWLRLEPLLTRHPPTLSGGERQRVAIGRALLASPRLLLMDEPLSALDAGARDEIAGYLERLPERLDVPVLYVSHSLDEVARLAGHMVLLDAGRVTASGPLATMLTRLDLPTAHGDPAGAVIDADIIEQDAGDGLAVIAFAGGRLVVARGDLTAGRRVRLRVAARDVSLALDPPGRTSILNVLPATVIELADEPPAQTMVSLDVGGTTLLARVTRRSRERLGLHPGMNVYAQVKSVALMA